MPSAPVCDILSPQTIGAPILQNRSCTIFNQAELFVLWKSHVVLWIHAPDLSCPFLLPLTFFSSREAGLRSPGDWWGIWWLGLCQGRYVSCALHPASVAGPLSFRDPWRGLNCSHRWVEMYPERPCTECIVSVAGLLAFGVLHPCQGYPRSPITMPCFLPLPSYLCSTQQPG